MKTWMVEQQYAFLGIVRPIRATVQSETQEEAEKAAPEAISAMVRNITTKLIPGIKFEPRGELVVYAV